MQRVRAYFTTAVGVSLQGILCGAAEAGAWTYDVGHGYSAVGVERDRGDFGTSWRQQVYFETGATKALTVVGKAETSSRELESFAQRTAVELSARTPLRKGRSRVVSVQAGALMGDERPGEICGGLGAEMRVLAGRSGRFGDRNFFLNAEGAYRQKSGCGHIATEFAAGMELAKNWESAVKLYSDTVDRADSLKVELGVSRRIGKSFLNAAYRREAGGDFNEESVIVSLWRRF